MRGSTRANFACLNAIYSSVDTSFPKSGYEGLRQGIDTDGILVGAVALFSAHPGRQPYDPVGTGTPAVTASDRDKRLQNR
jgi:hypothetical protein